MIEIVCPAVELGQGAHTALPRFVAEEMDADWGAVRVLQASANDKLYGNPLAWNTQITAASRTTNGYFDVLRVAGAQARYILLHTAAGKWRVPFAELSSRKSVVLHAKSGRRITYGELVGSIQMPASLPHFFAPGEAPQPADDYFGEAPLSIVAPDPKRKDSIRLKRKYQYQLIGVDTPRPDIPDKTTGKASYGMDVQLPGMLHAMVETGPVFGMAPEEVDEAQALQVPGIVRVLRLPYGVAVVGDNLIAVRIARRKLQVQWAPLPEKQGYGSDAVLQEFSELARETKGTAVRAWSQGDASATESALAAGARSSVERFEMTSDLVYQSPIEPQNATIRPSADGKSAEAWVGTQWPTVEQGFAASILGIPPDQLKMHLPYVGGGFGRRLEPGAMVDAAHIVRAVGKTVKVLWTREDDIKRNPFRQALACRIEAAVDEKSGQISAMRHTVVADSWLARLFPQYFGAYQQTDPGNWIGGRVAYDIPLQVIDAVTPRRSVDVCYMRGIGVAQVKFAQESLMDRLANQRKVDPIEFRVRHLKKEPRAVAVLNEVARMSNWRRRRQTLSDRSTALGVAYTPYSNAHVALVSEVSLNSQTGEIRVLRVWCALDIGLVAQPDIVKSQMEGGIVQGLSVALMERVTVERGVVQQTNFHNYPILRMSQMPDIAVTILATEHPMTGVAELGLLQIAPAINNAVAHLTGTHLTRLPMLPAQVLAAIKSP